MDITDIRARLAKRRGQWSEIAEAAGLNRKTVSRIMNDPEWMPNLRTLVDLGRAIEAVPPTPSKEAA
jgi:DNA-binding phage protein